MSSTISLFLPQFCQAILGSTAKSSSVLFWSFVQALWPWGWPLIVVGLTLWIVFEILTRNGGVHYDSANGFSPTFNRIVGSGIFLLFQTLLYLLLHWLFGDGIYCLPWPYPLHAFIFGLTWLFLWSIGFWVY
jgi:hypothetical protein